MRRAAAAVAALLFCATAAAGADGVQRLELEGSVGLGLEPPAPGVLRQRALDDAIAAAVDAVAREVLTGSGFDGPLEGALGSDPTAYTTRFGLLRDEGVREDRYVVLAEVWVDVDRVRTRLAAAGLAAPRRPAGPERLVLVVLEPLESHRAYAFVTETLGARPREMVRGRAVLEVATSGGPADLLAALQDAAPEGLRVVPGRIGPDVLYLAVEVE